MDLEKHFHMTGGSGSTSYARNSFLQKKASEAVKHIILEAVKRVYLQLTPVTIGIADLGCCSGPNTLSIIKDMVACIEVTTHLVLHPCPDFHLYLNDLPTNDFNTVFKALPDFRRELEELITEESPSFYIAGYPGSFYGRLFPSDSLHFVYSSNSLHWLSKVPPGLYDDNGKSINKGNIYISESSPAAVSRAYFSQFQEDFSSFLKSRSRELVPLGRMVLIFLGRSGPDHVDRGNSFLWELLSRALATTVSQGHIKEKTESYHAHFYAPSKDEIEEEVRRDCSFKIEKLEMFQIERNDKDGESYGTSVEKTVRAIQEPMILHHFSVGEGGLDTLFEKYGQLVDEEMAKEEIKPLTLLLVLRKLRLFEEVNIRNLLPSDSDERAS